MIVHKHWVWHFVGGNLSKYHCSIRILCSRHTYVTCMPNGRIIL